ncbi:heparin lyase I family protein [Pedobacter arcticus]|uniref:heparin lyase I family protein n=1 Tax=Pedobacter arcticus TaxID=752140 RepID=UPI00031CF5F5|nr:heparin lyase I family protein [Pedobacter arcticus]
MKTQKYLIIGVLFLIAACSKQKKTKLDPDKGINPPITVIENDTLLNVTYENGTTNSGITGVNSTHATAPDAAYMVTEAASGEYAVAHKVVDGDQGYWSSNSFRSESDASEAPGARFLPGNERRYEFSVLLKDWSPWNNVDPAPETNIFQLKLTNGEVPLQIRTKRNSMLLRFSVANKKPNVTVIEDVRSYVNKWIHFRIDVLWKDDNTGYMKTYMKLPEQLDYVLVDDKTNYHSYYASGNSGQHGYIKWGLYITPKNITRIAYHDDIRIIKLPLQTNK